MVYCKFFYTPLDTALHHTFPYVVSLDDEEAAIVEVLPFHGCSALKTSTSITCSPWHRLPPEGKIPSTATIQQVHELYLDTIHSLAFSAAKTSCVQPGCVSNQCSRIHKPQTSSEDQWRFSPRLPQVCSYV